MPVCDPADTLPSVLSTRQPWSVPPVLSAGRLPSRCLDSLHTLATGSRCLSCPLRRAAFAHQQLETSSSPAKPANISASQWAEPHTFPGVHPFLGKLPQPEKTTVSFKLTASLWPQGISLSNVPWLIYCVFGLAPEHYSMHIHDLTWVKAGRGAMGPGSQWAVGTY